MCKGVRKQHKMSPKTLYATPEDSHEDPPQTQFERSPPPQEKKPHTTTKEETSPALPQLERSLHITTIYEQKKKKKSVDSTATRVEPHAIKIQ